MNKKVSHCLVSRENNFDFIRFNASVAVQFSHSYALLQNTPDPVSVITQDKYSIGGFAIIIFFVISSSLINHSYHEAKNITNYALARVLRIYPALFVTAT